MNKGGLVPGTGVTDSVPAMLTPGEVVINKPAVQNFGLKNLLTQMRQENIQIKKLFPVKKNSLQDQFLNVVWRTHKMVGRYQNNLVVLQI